MDSTSISRPTTNQDGFSYKHIQETDPLPGNGNQILNVQPIYQKSEREFSQTSEYPLHAVQAETQNFRQERQSMNWEFSGPNDMFNRNGNSSVHLELNFNSKQFPGEGLDTEEISNRGDAPSQTAAENHFERVHIQKGGSAENALAEGYCSISGNKLSESSIDRSNLNYGNMVANANLETNMLSYAEPPFQNGTFESWRSIDSPQDIPSHFNPSSIEGSLSSTSIKNQVLSKELVDINCMDFKEINMELDNQNQAQDLNMTDNNHVSFYEVSKLLQNNSDLSNNFFDNSWLQSGNFHSFNSQPSLYNYISGMYLDAERYGFINQQPGNENALISTDMNSPMYDGGHNEHLLQQMPLYSNCDNLNGHIDFHNGTGDEKLASVALNRDAYQMQHLRMMDEASYVKTDYQQETFQATSFLSSLCYRDEKDLEQNNLKVYHSLETSKHGRISSQTSDSSVDTSGISSDGKRNSSLCDSNQYSENFMSANCDKSMYNVVYDLGADYYYKDFLSGSQNDLKNRSRGRGIKRSRQRSGRIPGRSSSRTEQATYDYVLHKDSISSYSTAGDLHNAQREGDLNKMEWSSKRNDVVSGDKFHYISKVKLPNKHNNSQLIFDTSKRPSNVNEAICKYMDYLILENECKTCISSCSTGVQLPYVGFEKERYFHEVMCQPISFPTAKFRDWLKLFDMDIEITDVDGLTASQTTFLPPLSQNNFMSPVIGLNESKISLNGVIGKPKDDLIIQSSRRSEIAIRSRGRPRKSWSSFSRYSDKDKNNCFDNPQFANECKTVFSAPPSNQNPYWTINRDQWQNKSALTSTNLSCNVNQGKVVSNNFLSGQLVQPATLQSDPRFASANASAADSKPNIRAPLRPYSNSIQVLKKGKNENIVIKVITPPKLQYKLNYEKLNGMKSSTQSGNNLDNQNNSNNAEQKQCDDTIENMNNLKEDQLDSKREEGIENNFPPKGLFAESESQEKTEERTCASNSLLSDNLSLECQTENELISDRSAVKEVNEIKCKNRKDNRTTPSRNLDSMELTEIEESISQCLDVGSNLEVQAEEIETFGQAGLRKRGRPRSSSSNTSTLAQVIPRKSKNLDSKSHETTNKMIKLDI